MEGETTEESSRGKESRLIGAVSIHERSSIFPDYMHVFGHWEGNTIVGKGRIRCVITLVERLSKRIVTLPTTGRKTDDIEESLHEWLTRQPINTVKSITFGRGLELLSGNKPFVILIQVCSLLIKDALGSVV